MRAALLVFATSLAAGAAAAAIAGQAPAGTPAAAPTPAAPMTFFVTSVGLGDGANLGGLAGADAHCQKLAAAVGRGGATWRAYLSTQGAGAVNARDRIGAGPWHNQAGRLIARDVAHLHGDTLDLARTGNAVNRTSTLDERGQQVKSAGDTPNQHDILTGSTPDGRAFPEGGDKTCRNWTASGEGAAQVGHSDRVGVGNSSWNSAHPSRGCSQTALTASGGAGLFYCFAAS